jgi:hypothetical protein
MYGGEISGNGTIQLLVDANGNGGGVCVQDGANFDMYNGFCCYCYCSS